jgi:hypothetical protein
MRHFQWDGSRKDKSSIVLYVVAGTNTDSPLREDNGATAPRIGA